MNRKYIVAVLAAAIILSGCSAVPSESEPTDISQSSNTSTSSTSTSQSSESTSSTTLSSYSSSSEESSSTETLTSELQSEVSSSSSSESSSTSSSSASTPPMTVGKRIVVAKERTIPNGDTFYINSGEVLEVKGTLKVEDGATVNVAEGGGLLVKGSVELDGELVLTKGSFLSMENDSASIDGKGSLVVKDSFEQIDCEHGKVKAHIKPPKRVVKDGVTTVGGVVIANKAIKLPPSYGSQLSDGEISPEVYSALTEMNSHSSHKYYIVSAYRSYYSQEVIFDRWCDIYGFDGASQISAQAGHSEHQTGLTMDLDSLEESYADTAEGKWLAQNCWKYGFIIRYPKGKENITGYSYEPWHVRYLGKSTASLVYHSGLTLEEFLGVEGGTVVID